MILYMVHNEQDASGPRPGLVPSKREIDRAIPASRRFTHGFYRIVTNAPLIGCGKTGQRQRGRIR